MPDDETNISRVADRPLGKLAKALAAAQGAIKNASKDAENPAFKRDGKNTTYSDLTAIWDACREALSKNEIAVIQAPEIHEGKLELHTLLIHSSGEWIDGYYPINPLQNTPQAFGSAMTYARRYSLASMVGVAPAGEDDDGNAGSGINAKGATKDTSPPPQVKEPPPKPVAKAKPVEPPPDAQKKVKPWCDGAYDLIAPAKNLDTLLEWENDPETIERMAWIKSNWTAQHERLALILKEKYLELEPANA